MAEAEQTSGDAVWDDWDVPPVVPSIPVLHLEGFDGPMDLLLDLAERQRIDLGRMSVQALAEQFVAAMARLAGRVPIERRADWLVMATRLVLLRSRLLLAATPAEAATAERDAAAELRRIGEMSFIRAVAVQLQARAQLGIEVFVRPQPDPPRREGGYVALMEACLVVLESRGEGSAARAHVYRPVIPDLWRVADALARIRACLADFPEGGVLGRFLPPIAPGRADGELRARAAVASTFVAGLQLAKDGVAEVSQNEAFGTIQVRAAILA